MTSKPDGTEADAYSVCQLQDGIIKTVFSALPTEQSARKQEQDRRRRYKEKVLADHHGELLIDSSYVTSEGQPVQMYTNTLLVADNLDWWQEKVEET